MKFLTLGEKMNPAILMLHGTLCSGEGSRSLGGTAGRGSLCYSAYLRWL